VTALRAILQLLVINFETLSEGVLVITAAGTLETTVEICVNASKLHPSGRLPHLQVGGSPWVGKFNSKHNRNKEQQCFSAVHQHVA
jgi:hypothetical protein